MNRRRVTATAAAGLSRMARAVELADRARVCFDAGLRRDAADLLGQALALEPGLLEARLLEARVRLACARPPSGEMEDRTDALARSTRLWESGQRALARAALPREPASSMPILRRQAALDVLLGSAQSAEATLGAWLALEPDAQSVRRLLARCVADGRPREGVELMLGPRRGGMPAHLRCWAARVLAGAGLTADAESLIVDLLEEHPRDAGLWHLAGHMARRAGRDAAAGHRLETAARRGRAMAAARSLMILHLRGGRFVAAGGWAWRRLRRLERARRDDVVRRRAEAWCVLAISAALSGRRTLAGRARREGAALIGPGDWRALRRRLWPHAATGLVLAAALAEESAVEGTSEARSPLQGFLRFACEQLAVHTAAWPNRADAYHHLAVCRQALGEVRAAAAANHAALALNPRYGDALALRERLRGAGNGSAA